MSYTCFWVESSASVTVVWRDGRPALQRLGDRRSQADLTAIDTASPRQHFVTYVNIPLIARFPCLSHPPKAQILKRSSVKS